MAVTILACYDISDDGRRAKVAARLQRHGDRLQFSVFLCTVDVAELAQLVDDVSAMLDLDTDAFFVARQCAGCFEDRVIVGQAQPPTPELYWAVF